MKCANALEHQCLKRNSTIEWKCGKKYPIGGENGEGYLIIVYFILVASYPLHVQPKPYVYHKFKKEYHMNGEMLKSLWFETSTV